MAQSKDDRFRLAAPQLGDPAYDQAALLLDAAEAPRSPTKRRGLKFVPPVPSPGDVGPHVMDWQNYLRQQGYDLEPSGQYDGQTDRATQHWLDNR